MSATQYVKLYRHRNVRLHQTVSADVPVAMLANPAYFDGDIATPAFDQWICDNGYVTHEELGEVEGVDEDLVFDAVLDPA